jgi:hypothetical protein
MSSHQSLKKLCQSSDLSQSGYRPYAARGCGSDCPRAYPVGRKYLSAPAEVRRHDYLTGTEKTFFMANEFDQLTSAASGNDTHREGLVARSIEHQTAKVPSDVFLWAALGSMGVAAVLKCFGKKHDALFVGQWAAPFLLLGVYNKLVKVAGHDQEDNDNNKDG